MYVYIKSEPHLWTVGFYDPTGKFRPESDHSSSLMAWRRVVDLNGGSGPGIVDKLDEIIGLLRALS